MAMGLVGVDAEALGATGEAEAMEVERVEVME